MKKYGLVISMLLVAGLAYSSVRTVVFMYKETVVGQDIFIKGGHDAGLVPSVYPSMSEPIVYNNTLNATTASIKANDASLDWGTESALDWTCNAWPTSWGTKKTYAVDGYGEDPENTMGLHWWKFDVMMDGTSGDWYEFKAFMREGTTEWWESDRQQSGTPYTTINHWGKKGYITKCKYNDNWVEFSPLTTPVNQAPTASFTVSPSSAYTGETFTVDASASSDPEDGSSVQVRWDWENDGTYDTDYSSTKTATHSYSTAGTKTIAVQVKDTGGLTATKTLTVTVNTPPESILTVHYRNSSGWTSPLMHWGYNYYDSVANLAAAGSDTFGAYYQINWTSTATYLTTCFTSGSGSWDGTDRKITKPSSFPYAVWILNSDATVYTSNPIDATPPTASLTAPTSGSTVSGTITVSATASDNVGVSKVEFYAGSTKIGEDTSSPYSISWSTIGYSGSVVLMAKAYDAAGNTGNSATRTVTVNNPNQAPVANAGGNKTGIPNSAITFDGSGSYDVDGSIVQYSWNFGSTTKTGQSVTYTYTATGTYSVTLTVTDDDGATSSQTITVTVSTQPTRTDFREETIYFLMTTRFMDGDPNNNVHCWDDSQAGNPDSDPAWRGDFEGLIQKLDYIKALGFSAIWITPVVQNASGYDYHGYHALNFKKVDPRYKTSTDSSAEESFQRLINAAHAKGMKIILDVVLNHSGNFGEENLYPLFKKDPSLSDDTAANLIRIDGGKLPANYDSLTPTEQYGARIAAMKEDSVDTSFLYHHEKSMSWESYTVQTGQIAGDCVDLNTENPTTAQYLIDAYNQYIDMGVDGFRVDTVKHVSRLTFNNYFIPAFKQRGGDNFYIFGEVCTRYRQIWNNGIPAISTPFYTWKEDTSYSWGTRTQNEASVYQNWDDNDTVDNEPTEDNHWLNGNTYHTPDWTRRSGLDVIDFPMHWNFNNAYDAYNVALGGDWYYSDPTWNVTYVDSHDYAPDCAPEDKRFSGAQDTWAENLSLMFTFRGIPCIFYGSEIEFQKGCPIDKGPNAPLSTTGRAYYGDYMAGTVNASDFGVYTASGTVANTLSYPLAKHIRRLNMIRRSIPALQKGQYSTDGVSGGMAYKRRYTSGSVDSFALICVSGGATFSGIPNGTYIDAVTGDVKVVTGGSLSASCYGKGNIRVYVLDLTGNPAPGKIGEATEYLY